MTDFTEAHVETRMGKLDRVTRTGEVIVFGVVITGGERDALANHPAYPTRRAELDRLRAEQRNTRKRAVAWMATNPKMQRGVRLYRFDYIDAEGNTITRDAF